MGMSGMHTFMCDELGLELHTPFKLPWLDVSLPATQLLLSNGYRNVRFYTTSECQALLQMSSRQEHVLLPRTLRLLNRPLQGRLNSLATNST